MRVLALRSIAVLLASLLANGSAMALDAGQVFEKRAPAVWEVLVYGSQTRLLKMGSAVVTGHEELVTNCHVLGGGKSVSVKHESVVLPATLRYADPERDLCLLQASGLSVDPVPVAESETLKVGQRVYTVGAPRGLELTLADGLIAGLRRDKDGKLVRIQVSAPISEGSSGGGLFDSEGRLVGIPFMTLRDAQNLNFAIPAAWIREIPERGRAALAAYRARQTRPSPTAQSGQPAAPASAAPSLPGRRLTPVELQNRFAVRRQFVASDTAGAQFDFAFDPSGDIRVTRVGQQGKRAHPYSDGRFRIVDGDTLCLSLGDSEFDNLQGCYWLYEEGAHYVMHAVAAAYALTYPVSP